MKSEHLVGTSIPRFTFDTPTTPGSDCALTSLAVDEPLEYARLYLEGNLQMWVDTEDSLEL